uniref:Uncharacterized protein n=1 Tax=Bubo bubo TaxID=30461 RepID=A0A8C0FQB3_BUBBB
MNSHFLSIQCFFKYNLRHFNTISSHVDTQGEMLAGAHPRVGYLSDLQDHLRLGELGRVVVHVEDVHLNTVELEGILHDELEVQGARGALPAQSLPVQPAVQEQHARRQVHLEVASAQKCGWEGAEACGRSPRSSPGWQAQSPAGGTARPALSVPPVRRWR